MAWGLRLLLKRPATVALPNRCRLQDPYAEFPGVLDQQSIELTAIHD